MEEFVEGDWKNFTFKMAKPEDYPGILEHMNQNFHQDEPQNKMMGMTEQMCKDMDYFVTLDLVQNLSFFVIDRHNNKIIGAGVSGISRKDDDPTAIFSEIKSPELREIIPNIQSVLKEANTFEKVGIDYFGDITCISVDRAYRSHGLATEIFSRAIKLLEADGVPAVESVVTSPHSQNIARKFGFTELARKSMKDYTKSDGSLLFPQARDEDIAIVMIKLNKNE